MTDQQTTTSESARGSITHGHVPEPGASDLQTGDFGLDGDLRATMLAALEANWNTDDPGATQLPDTPDNTTDADTEASPGPAPATPSPTGEEGDGGAGEGAAPESAPVTPPVVDDAGAFSLDSYAEEYFGTRLTPTQARELFSVLGGLQSLTPEQRQMLDQTLAGGAPNQYPATQGQPINPQQPITPAGSPAAYPPANSPAASPLNLPPRPDDEYEAAIYDKYIAPLAQATQSQLSDLQANIAATTQAQLARQQAEMDAAIAEASTAWRAEYPVLSEGEYDALVDKIIRSGTFPALIRTHGSPASATRAALEQFFWADPNLRAKAIANAASGRLPGDPTTTDPTSPIAQQQADIERNRQARAAAVAGGGGSTQARGPAPIPKDKDARKQAMIQELATQGDFA